MKRPVLLQEWHDLLFLHWRFDPQVVARTLPDDLEPETFDGSAWVGIVPFFMQRVRPVGLPCVPLLSWFLELNVRTYVRHRTGTAVWFYSLDCNQPIAVELARAFFGLPYEHAKMQARRGLFIDYRCRRRGEAEGWHYRYRGSGRAQAAAPDSLEAFLLERYAFFSGDVGRRRLRGVVRHAPYQYENARVLNWTAAPLLAAGFPHPERVPDHIAYSRRVIIDALPVERVVSE